MATTSMQKKTQPPQETPLKRIARLLVNPSTTDIGAKDTGDEQWFVLAVEHGVASLLSESLLHHPTHKASPIAKLAQDYDLHHSRRIALLDYQYQQVLQALHQNHIRFVVLKGYALAFSVYSRPSLRSRSDIDILIDPSQQGELRKIMTDMGFANPRGWQPKEILNQFSMRKTLSAGLNIDFDIHLKINNDVNLKGLLQLDELLTNATRLKQSNVPVINIPNGIIHAAIHLLHHRNVGDMVKLIWLYDLQLLCEKINQTQQQQLVEAVEQKRLKKPICFALSLADEMFDNAALKSVMASLADCGSDEKFNYLLEVDSQTTQLKRALAERKTWREKWHFCQEILFPPAAEITVKYGKKSSLWLPFYYVKRAWQGTKKRLRK